MRDAEGRREVEMMVLNIFDVIEMVRGFECCFLLDD